MKLLFKQKMFSWLDSYEIYNEEGDIVYTVKGQLDWGHCLKIYDSNGQYVGMVREKVLTFMPRFDLYVGEEQAASQISAGISVLIRCPPSPNPKQGGWSG